MQEEIYVQVYRLYTKVKSHAYKELQVGYKQKAQNYFVTWQNLNL